jgi:hypothetical protein
MFDERPSQDPNQRAARGGELRLLGGVFAQGIMTLCNHSLPAQAADLDLRDELVAELGVADARSLVRRRRLRTGDLGDREPSSVRSKGRWACNGRSPGWCRGDTHGVGDVPGA